MMTKRIQFIWGKEVTKRKVADSSQEKDFSLKTEQIGQNDVWKNLKLK
jgi:hypothetical protein